MSVLNLARVVVYRFHQKGLEIFLINDDLKNDPSAWKIPSAAVTPESVEKIQLEPIKNQQGEIITTYAVEGDWHDIPSIRGIIKHDVELVKSKIMEAAPGVEKGGFFAVKEAFKKIMPEEYNSLKELKEILSDRNLTKFI